MNFGPTEMLIVLVIILVLFGGAKLPQLAKGLGEGIRNFKQATREDEPREDAEKLSTGETPTGSVVEKTSPAVPPTVVK
jgi:sec-independent protein translocase protein TatA